MMNSNEQISQAKKKLVANHNKKQNLDYQKLTEVLIFQKFEFP